MSIPPYAQNGDRKLQTRDIRAKRKYIQEGTKTS